jgi:hypothetical protein
MAGMMDAIEGMAECVWWIAGDGFVESVGVIGFDLKACVMMVVMMMMREVVAVARQCSLYLCLPPTNFSTQHRP